MSTSSIRSKLARAIRQELQERNPDSPQLAELVKESESDEFNSLIADGRAPVSLDNFKNDFKDESGPGRRKAARYGLRVEVLISSVHRTFRTKTTNVSMTGLLLQDFLPAEFDQVTLDVVLVISEDPQHKKYIVFKGKAISAGPFKTQRISFCTSSPSSHAELAKLVEDLTPILPKP